jgi:polyphenol oxidase
LRPDLNPDWIIPQWPAPAHVRAICTTRAGGASRVPYDSMNLGDHVGDDLHDVTKNRSVLRDATHATPVFLTQVHGVQVVEFDGSTPHGTGLQADACVTRYAGVACTIMVADCLPVLFTNRHGTVVGAAHAGWRGLAGEPDTAKTGVLEAIYQRFLALALLDIRKYATSNVANQDILVWLGPCIGPDKFEVGSDVRDAFLSSDAAAQGMFKPWGAGKWLADLAGLARLRLQALGVESIYGNDGSRAWCTVSNPSRFFSHRRDAVALGGSGRMAACIWLG